MSDSLKDVRGRPRSPVAEKVFRAFLEELRADPFVDDGMRDRLESLLNSGRGLDAENLGDALFPEDGGGERD